MSNADEQLPLASEPLVSISPEFARASGRMLVNTGLIQEVLIGDGVPEALAQSFAVELAPLPKRSVTSGLHYNGPYIPPDSPVQYSSRITLSIPDKPPGLLSNFSLWHELGHLRQSATGNHGRMLYYSGPHLKATRTIGSLGIASALSYELAAKLTGLPSLDELPTPAGAGVAISGVAACMAAIAPEGALWLTSAKEWDAHRYAARRINHKIISWKD